jgi:hypothetical protein
LGSECPDLLTSGHPCTIGGLPARLNDQLWPLRDDDCLTYSPVLSGSLSLCRFLIVHRGDASRASRTAAYRRRVRASRRSPRAAAGRPRGPPCAACRRRSRGRTPGAGCSRRAGRRGRLSGFAAREPRAPAAGGERRQHIIGARRRPLPKRLLPRLQREPEALPHVAAQSHIRRIQTLLAHRHPRTHAPRNRLTEVRPVDVVRRARRRVPAEHVHIEVRLHSIEKSSRISRKDLFDQGAIRGPERLLTPEILSDVCGDILVIDSGIFSRSSGNSQQNNIKSKSSQIALAMAPDG